MKTLSIFSKSYKKNIIKKIKNIFPLFNLHIVHLIFIQARTYAYQPSDYDSDFCFDENFS